MTDHFEPKSVKVKKERRPSGDRRQIRELQKELGSNYTTALREWERRKKE